MKERFYSHKRLTKKQRLKIVKSYIRIVNKGVSLKRAYIKIRSKYNISKATIYNYLKEFKHILN